MNKSHAQITLLNYWNGSIPVDVVDITERMGIKLRMDDNLIGHYSGQALKLEDGSFNIIYNPKDTLTRQRFTVAHEIGHIVLGHLNDQNTRFRDSKENFGLRIEDPKEKAANEFAMELLMPASIVTQLVKKGRAKSIENLCEFFKVSESAMYYRLVDLGHIDAK